MSQITLPNALADGTTAYGSEVRENDDAIVLVVNGGLDDGNIAVSAAIAGSKLSNVAGSRVPTDRIEDDAVTADKLRDDAVTDANRAVTTNHIRDAAVRKAKVALSAYDWSIGGLGPIPIGQSIVVNTSLTTAVTPLSLVVLGGTPTAAGDQARISPTLQYSSATSTYWLTVPNHKSAATQVITGITIRLYYIPA